MRFSMPLVSELATREASGRSAVLTTGHTRVSLQSFKGYQCMNSPSSMAHPRGLYITERCSNDFIDWRTLAMCSVHIVLNWAQLWYLCALFFSCFVFTDYGTIKKVRAPLSQSSGSCLLEEIELFPERKSEPIRSLKILHSQSVLFVGLQEHVVKIPLKRCHFHQTRG